MKRTLAAFALGAILTAGCPALAVADDVAQFYTGKKIDFIIGTAPGGGYDVYGRLVVRHIGKHIPGQPNVIAKNMPGGSSRVAAGFVFNVAPKDGTVIATINQDLTLAKALGESLQFDPLKYGWIGSPDFDVRVVTTWHTTGVKTIADAKAREVTMGASGATDASGYPEILNTLTGTRFRTVRGYQSGSAVNLAMERGEVDGRADNAWSSWVGDHGEWVRDRKINILIQVGLTKDPDLPNVPVLLDFGRTGEERAALRLLSTPSSMGHPIVTPPGTPEVRLAALRAAFDKTMIDQAFLDDAKNSGRPIRPVTGAELEKIVKETLGAPKDIIDRIKLLTK